MESRSWRDCTPTGTSTEKRAAHGKWNRDGPRGWDALRTLGWHAKLLRSPGSFSLLARVACPRPLRWLIGIDAAESP